MQVGQIGEDRGSPKTAAAFLLHSNEGGRQVFGRVASSVGNLLDCIFSVMRRYRTNVSY